jgi:hypothetical protein
MKFRLSLVLAALAPFAAGPLRAESIEQVIARARAYLGSESALNAVTSIHYTGKLELTEKVPSPEDKTKQVDRLVSLPAEIIFQKPYQYRQSVTRPGFVITIALDGYDGWSQSTNPQDPAQWRVTLLGAQQVKQLRANTWENLSFFTGLGKKGGRVELVGDVTVEGVACVKLSFIHADNIVFHRFLDKATGRLVKTETDNGGEIREEGEILVNGVRFPRKVINKAANGQVTTIAIDKVVVNEQIPASEFAVPALRAN